MSKWDCAIVVLPLTHKNVEPPLWKTNNTIHYVQMVDFPCLCQVAWGLTMLQTIYIQWVWQLFVPVWDSLGMFGIVWMQESQDTFNQICNFPISLGLLLYTYMKVVKSTAIEHSLRSFWRLQRVLYWTHGVMGMGDGGFIGFTRFTQFEWFSVA